MLMHYSSLITILNTRKIFFIIIKIAFTDAWLLLAKEFLALKKMHKKNNAEKTSLEIIDIWV